MCVCMCESICVSVCVYMCMCVNVCVYMCESVSVCICVRVCVSWAGGAVVGALDVNNPPSRPLLPPPPQPGPVHLNFDLSRSEGWVGALTWVNQYSQVGSGRVGLGLTGAGACGRTSPRWSRERSPRITPDLRIRSCCATRTEPLPFPRMEATCCSLLTFRHGSAHCA